LGRIVQTDSGASHRRRVLSTMGLALRTAASQPDGTPDESRDLLAYLALCLDDLRQSTEQTARAWEARGYWVKADHFRTEWVWVTARFGCLQPALMAEDWARARICASELAGALAGRRLRIPKSRATPWKGAWEAWGKKHRG